MGNKCKICTDHNSLKYIFTYTELNMRQRRWLELIKDYELEIHYHLGKANVVAVTLSHKSYCNLLTGEELSTELCAEMEQLRLDFVSTMQLNELRVHCTLEDQIKQAQGTCQSIAELRVGMEKGLLPDFRKDRQGTIWLGNRLCVPRDENIRKAIMTEAHCTKYSIHPESTKMYQDLKKLFWLRRMKRDIAEFVAKCDTCNRIKAEKQMPAGLLKPLEIPMSKWEKITMDFIVGLPRTPNTPKLVELYVQNILRLHGVPLSIVSDRGPQFTAQFWKSLHKAMGTKLDYSTAYHPQTDGQTEWANQLLEDLLRACVLTYGPNWEDSLPFVQFSYNNSYQVSLKMSPFQVLYGRQCRTPLMWEEAGERQFYGPAMFIEAAKNVAKVSPLRGTKRFHTRGKLAPRYIGPFRIKRKVGDLAYELELPEHLSGVHPVFHVSQLRKCLRLPEEQILLEAVDLQDNLEYLEYSVQILDLQRKVQEERRFLCAKCYGATTPKEKLPGKKSRICGRCILTSSRS
ncbi:hypothetical protein U9M48_036083, partial [Paspalum notatum var. saurae]